MIVNAGTGDDNINVNSAYAEIFADSGNDQISAFGYGVNVDAGDGDDTLDARILNGTVDMGVGDDTVYSSGFGTTIDLGEGNDWIWASGTGLQLDGGEGNDTINLIDNGSININDNSVADISGGTGNDSINLNAATHAQIQFNAGDGDDVISGRGSFALSFGADISPTLLTYERVGQDLLINIPSTGATINDSILVKNAFNADFVLSGSFTFIDGQIIQLEEILQTVKAQLTFEGSTGVDEFFGTNSGEYFYGRDGDDLIYAGGGNDEIHGGDGADDLGAGAGDDIVLGGTGNDSIDGGAGNDFLDAGSGNDVIVAGEGDDHIVAGSGNDLIFADSGNNLIYANEGNDDIHGSADGSDIIYAGSGDDIVHTYSNDEEGQNLVFGEDGNDTLTGNQGNELLDGGDGNDILSGGQGYDLLKGGTGSDTYHYNLGDGWDRIREESFNTDETNVVILGEGITLDMLSFSQSSGEGVQSNDTTTLNYSGLIISIQGTDEELDIEDFFRSFTDIDSGEVTESVPDTAAISEIQFADGSTLSARDIFDILGIDYPGKILTGTDADDFLLGTDADDTIDGGAGDDYMDGGFGSDTYLYGRGSGNDTIFEFQNLSEEPNRVVFNDDISPDDLKVIRSEFGSLTFEIKDTGETLRIEQWFASNTSDEFAQQLPVTEFVFADGTIWTPLELMELIEPAGPILGTEGDDLLMGTDNDDTINGLGGDDTLRGNDGDDTLFAGHGDDNLSGGRGNDTLIAESGDNYLNGDDGDDILVSGTGDDYLRGGAGNDTYTISFFGGNDTINEVSADFNEINRIEFVDVGSHNVEFQRVENSNDLLIVNAFSGSEILIPNWFIGLVGDDNQVNYRISEIQFSDGTVYDVDAIIEALGDISITPEFHGTNQNDFITGTDAADGMWGYSGDDILEGRSGDDLIYGNKGADQLRGGTGNDRLEGGKGNDVYWFDVGDGQDIISDSKGNDSVMFGPDVDPESVEIVRFLNEDGIETLLIKYGLNDSITIENWATNPVEAIGFLGGPQWDLSTINQNYPLQLTDNADVYVDGNGSSFVAGLAGDDHIQAMKGNDTLIGGTGNDRLEGGEGRDTYVFNLGDGQDVIFDSKGNDTIEFGQGITADNVSITRFINGSGVETLLIEYGSGDSSSTDSSATDSSDIDTITIENWATNPIENVLFDDGTQWTVNAINQTVPLNLSDSSDAYVDSDSGNTILAMAGNDHIQAMGGNDTLIGGTGDDRLEGGKGRDTYVFSVGDGQDIIADIKGNDNILFSDGISPDDVTISSVIDDDGNESLLLSYGNGDSITIENWNTNPIEKISFFDGTEWSKKQINQNLSLHQSRDRVDIDDSTHSSQSEVFDVDTFYEKLIGSQTNVVAGDETQEPDKSVVEEQDESFEHNVENMVDILNILVQDDEADYHETADTRYERMITTPPIVVFDTPIQ